MRTTIDINPELLDKVLEETGERTKGRAIDRVMEEFLRRRALEKLLAARGKFHLKVKHAEWEEAELAAELEHQRNRK